MYVLVDEPRCLYDPTSHSRARTEPELQMMAKLRCLWNSELDATNGSFPETADTFVAECYE